VEPDAFARCITGGVCQPHSIQADGIAGLDDEPLPANLPEVAPYVEPMIALPATAEACDVGSIGDPASAASFANCMAVAIMDPGQHAILACFGTALTPAGRASCADLGTTPEEKVVAACLAAGVDDPTTLVSCAGGRLTARELSRCISMGDEPAECFGAGGMVAPALREIARDVDLLLGEDAGTMRPELEKIAASLEQGDANASMVRGTLKDLGNDLQRIAGGDERISNAFNAIAPRQAAQ
jgi:hypothetical protein